MRTAFLTGLLCLCMVAATAQVTAVRIHDAWIQEAPPGVDQLGGYLEIHNAGQETRILESVSSPVFKRIEIHRTRIEGDVAKMERKNSLTLSPGQQITFKPGDYHLMLYNPAQPLRVGDRVELTFSFQDRPSVTIEAEVRRANGGAETHHQHHH